MATVTMTRTATKMTMTTTTTTTTVPAKEKSCFFPHATGSAYTTVQKHTSQEEPLKFYCGWFSPFSQRVWLALEEKNIPYEYIEIDPFNKSKEFLTLNPRGLVPTLSIAAPGEDGEKQKPLYESSVIVSYLDEFYSGVGLVPDDVYERARCRLWIDHGCTRIIPAFYRWLQHTPEKDYSVQEARGEFWKHILTFAKEIDATGPYFLGERFSMVDIMLAPWACRLFVLDHYKPGGLGMPEKGTGGEDEAAWEKWRTWLNATSNRQSVKNTMSAREQYIDAYKRYAQDTMCSEIGQATRKGRGLP